MKKLLCVLLCILTAISITSCGVEESVSEPVYLNNTAQIYEYMPDGELHSLKEPDSFFGGYVLGVTTEDEFIGENPYLEETFDFRRQH